MTAKSKKEDGFTLVEVLVVMAIIAIMAGFVVMNLLPEQGKAQVQRAKSDIRTLETALEMYRLDMGRYPDAQDGLLALRTPPSDSAQAAKFRPGGYIKNTPKDPWGNDYIYVIPGENGVYDLLSYGADGQPGGADMDADIVNWGH